MTSIMILLSTVSRGLACRNVPNCNNKRVHSDIHDHHHHHHDVFEGNSPGGKAHGLDGNGGSTVKTYKYEANTGFTAKMQFASTGKLFRKVRANVYDPEEILKDCDSAGVDLQVLSTVPVMFNYDIPSPTIACEWARFINQDMANTMKTSSNPKRFAGLGHIPMQCPELAAKELERCVLEDGLKGVQIGSHINLPKPGDGGAHSKLDFSTFK
jgi:predicted TIM-barrel fold metal-dependent hydrolase